jgi:hypothetical protein
MCLFVTAAAWATESPPRLPLPLCVSICNSGSLCAFSPYIHCVGFTVLLTSPAPSPQPPVPSPQPPILSPLFQAINPQPPVLIPQLPILSSKYQAPSSQLPIPSSRLSPCLSWHSERLTTPCHASPCLVWLCVATICLASPSPSLFLASPHLAFSRLTSPRFFSPHLTSPRFFSPHLTSLFLPSPRHAPSLLPSPSHTSPLHLAFVSSLPPVLCIDCPASACFSRCGPGAAGPIGVVFGVSVAWLAAEG